MKLPRLELGGDELTLINPEKTNLKFSEFTSAFSVKQFIGESAFEHQSNFTGGQSILYLKIPKNLNLIDLADLNPQYVKR